MFKSSILGLLGADAEVRNLESGQAAISFSVAHSEKWKDRQGNVQERTTWVRCTLWRKSDQVGVAQYLKKGAKVYAEGRVQARAWADAQGKPQASLEMTVTELDPFCGGTKPTTTAQAAAPAQSQAAAQDYHARPDANAGFGPATGSNIFSDNDDLPF